MTFTIPESLVSSCQHASETMDWLSTVPALIALAKDKWHLELEEPFDGEEVSCSWVAPAMRSNGEKAILKIGMPHMEGLHELEGLLCWNGDHCIRVLDYLDEPRVMLLERCIPGTRLRELPEVEQDEVIASLLKKLWRVPDRPHPFRTLSELMIIRKQEVLGAKEDWTDPELTHTGLDVLMELSQHAPASVLLAFDLHAGNVLRAERAPWLVIDPKPFIGDPAYDATQHLYNCRPRLYANPEATMRRMADLLEVEYQRVRLWMFGRAAADPRKHWKKDALLDFARAIAP